MHNLSRFSLGLLSLKLATLLLGCNGGSANEDTQFANDCYQLKEAINQSELAPALVTKAAVLERILRKEELVRKLEILSVGDRQLQMLKSQLVNAYREDVQWSRVQMSLMSPDGTITVFEQSKAQLDQIQSNQTKANKLTQIRYEQLRDYCALK